MFIKLCLVLIAIVAASGCDKPEKQPKICNVNNPLTDLSWLKTKNIFCLYQKKLKLKIDKRLYICCNELISQLFAVE